MKNNPTDTQIQIQRRATLTQINLKNKKTLWRLVLLPTVEHKSPWSNHFYLTSNLSLTAGIRTDFTGNPLFSSPLSPLSFYFSFYLLCRFSLSVSFPFAITQKWCGEAITLCGSVCLPICPSVRLPLPTLPFRDCFGDRSEFCCSHKQKQKNIWWLRAPTHYKPFLSYCSN